MRLSPLKRGLPVLDSGARVVGRVEGTWPDDGSGDPDYAVVRIRRFGGEHKLLPVRAARFLPSALQVPFSASHIDDAPAFDPDRRGHEQAARARSFWGEHAGDEAGRLGYARLVALRD